jgi:cytochrome d ubiquinol oxidase subunit II
MPIEAIWFALLAVVLAFYVVLDGFDFGAGALHLFVARSDGERRQVLASIGPFWDGNEVWLLAAGGMLFLAFPKVLGAGLSGFYLAVMMLLWVLILRGIAIEFRSHVGDALWRSFWDTTFAGVSTLAPVLLGAALANLLRGVPLDGAGWFALPLFASWSPTGELGILDWYTVLAGVFALLAIAHHGALFLTWKTDGPVHERSRRFAARLFPVVVVGWILTTAATAQLAPAVFTNLRSRPLGWAATALLLGGLATSWLARRAGHDRRAFLGSAAFLFGTLAATAASLYPTMVRAVDPTLSLTALNAASSPAALRTGLLWWPFGFVLAIFYFVVLFRLHRGKVAVATDGEGY